MVTDLGVRHLWNITMCELYRLLGIKLAMLMAYHPQTDGQTECINQVLEGYLCIFTSRRQDNWDDLLSSGKFHCKQCTLINSADPLHARYRKEPSHGL
jgi:hypothetical protein